jgi:transketolase
LATLAANTLRFLAVDAVEKARSGHPGMPMGMADAAYVLWSRFLRHDPRDPAWPGRDRFVLSAGHGSMLLYALLHLSGYDLPMDESEALPPARQPHAGTSRARHDAGRRDHHRPARPGLRERRGHGARLAHGGRALRRLRLSPGAHRVFAIAGDGCMMEGISHEAASLAGYLQLGNLVVLYDDNRITIDGSTSITFTDDTAKRFEAYGWQVLRADALDQDAVAKALEQGIAETARPTLIICRSHIGYGAPHKQDTAHAHGEPLGPEEVLGAKRALGWPESPTFLIPDDVRAHFDELRQRWANERTDWDAALARWRSADPERAERWTTFRERRVAAGMVERLCASAPTNCGGDARPRPGRDPAGGGTASGPDRRQRRPRGEYADRIADSGYVSAKDFSPRNLHFGVREHAMTAVCNGSRCPWLAAVLRLVPHLHRLRAPRDPPRGADEAARHLRLHARQHLPRRGRAHAPVDRAPLGAAADPQPARDPPRGRARDRRGMGTGARAHRRSDAVGALAPDAARARRVLPRSRPPTSAAVPPCCATATIATRSR